MNRLKRGGVYFFLIIASVISIFPIYYALCLASGGNVDLQAGAMVPGVKLWENISYILFETNFKEPFFYTLCYCLLQTFCLYTENIKKALEKIAVLMYNISWLTRAISSPEILSKINFII